MKPVLTGMIIDEDTGRILSHNYVQPLEKEHDYPKEQYSVFGANIRLALTYEFVSEWRNFDGQTGSD